jgi:hypothetical protein
MTKKIKNTDQKVSDKYYKTYDKVFKKKTKKEQEIRNENE